MTNRNQLLSAWCVQLSPDPPPAHLMGRDPMSDAPQVVCGEARIQLLV